MEMQVFFLETSISGFFIMSCLLGCKVRWSEPIFYLKLLRKRTGSCEKVTHETGSFLQTALGLLHLDFMQVNFPASKTLILLLFILLVKIYPREKFLKQPCTWNKFITNKKTLKQRLELLRYGSRQKLSV